MDTKIFKIRLYVLSVAALFYFNNISYSAEIGWRPNQSQWARALSSVSFFNGDEIEVADHDLKTIGAKSLLVKSKSQYAAAGPKVENDLVYILQAFPSANQATVAIVYSSCSGVICGLGKLYLVYLNQDELRIEEIFDASSERAVLTLKLDQQGLKEANYSDLDFTKLDAIGDPAVVNRRLILGKGFVAEGFRDEYVNLIGKNAESFFSSQAARTKLLKVMEAERFKAYRLEFGGPSESALVNGRLVVFTGCQTHACSSKRSALVFDGESADTWIVSVDLEKKQLRFAATRPLVDADIEAVQAIHNLGVTLSVVRGELKASH